MTPALGVVLVLVLVAVLLEIRRLARVAPERVAGLESKVDALSQQLGARIGESAAAAGQLTSLMQAQLQQTNQSLSALAERLGRLDEATRQVEQVGQSIHGIEKLLASPKLRGGLGEWTLERLLADVLPAEQIARQHLLPSRGVLVDVAVRAADGQLIPIDSKFPVESFRRLLEAESAGGAEIEARRREFHRAVRKRVDEIAEKYIAPEDGTLDFALMYVPSETIYYELAVRETGEEFLEHARARRVVPCSPNTLYAYLQAILLGVRGVQIAQRAREIQAALQNLGQDLRQARELFDRAAGQLRFASQNVEAAGAALSKVEARVEGVARVGAEEPAAPLPADEQLALAGPVGEGDAE